MRAKNDRQNLDWERLQGRIDTNSRLKPTSSSVTRGSVKDTTNSLKPVQSTESTQKDVKKRKVSVNLTLPKIKPSKKYTKVAIGLAGAVVVGLAGLGIYNIIDKPKNTDITDVLADTVVEPEFDTVLPNGKKDETQDNKIGYNPERKVASFQDTIGTVVITVSQQPLPESFKANPDDEVKKLAEGFSAYNVINESSPKAYLGNDVSGAQTIIFHKKDLLIFILSPKTIEKDQWAEYITKLL